MRLVRFGVITRQMNFNLYYQEQLVDTNFLDLMRNTTLSDQFYNIWNSYITTAHFENRLMPDFPTYSREQLERVGRETIDSFFSGRWYELCHLSIGLVMCSLVNAGPDADHPASAPLRRITDVIQFVESISMMVSKELMFTFVAPEVILAMSNLALFKS